MLTPTDAKLLREMMARIQDYVLLDDRISNAVKVDVVTEISTRGFGLVDELEGVIR